MVFAAFLMMPLGQHGDPSPAVIFAQAAETPARGDLHDRIADDVRAMNDRGRGIFNEDISAIVAPYFPPGTTFDETQALTRAQHLQPLKPYEGRQDHPGSMFVTTFDMTKAMFSSVFVAIYFTFERSPAGERVLKNTAAFLRASDM